MLLECHQGGTGSKGHEQAQATALGHDLGFNLLPACERELELFSRMKDHEGVKLNSEMAHQHTGTAGCPELRNGKLLNVLNHVWLETPNGEISPQLASYV
jgi:hypothetical protein